MNEVITKLDQETLLGLVGMMLGLVAIIGGIIVAITVVFSAHRRRTQLDEMEATLKMEMIQRGMSAEEIAQVLGAKMGANKTALDELVAKIPRFQMPGPCGKTVQKPEAPLPG
jgi:hypothetical protein